MKCESCEFFPECEGFGKDMHVCDDYGNREGAEELPAIYRKVYSKKKVGVRRNLT